MVPDDVAPVCQKLHMSIKKVATKKSGQLKELFANMALSTGWSKELDEVDAIEVVDRIPTPVYYWSKNLGIFGYFPCKVSSHFGFRRRYSR